MNWISAVCAVGSVIFVWCQSRLYLDTRRNLHLALAMIWTVFAVVNGWSAVMW